MLVLYHTGTIKEHWLVADLLQIVSKFCEWFYVTWNLFTKIEKYKAEETSNNNLFNEFSALKFFIWGQAQNEQHNNEIAYVSFMVDRFLLYLLPRGEN